MRGEEVIQRSSAHQLHHQVVVLAILDGGEQLDHVSGDPAAIALEATLRGSRSVVSGRRCRHGGARLVIAFPTSPLADASVQAIAAPDQDLPVVLELVARIVRALRLLLPLPAGDYTRIAPGADGEGRIDDGDTQPDPLLSMRPSPSSTWCDASIVARG